MIKTKIITALVAAIVIVSLVVVINKQSKKINSLKQNENYILKENSRYKINDSLNVFSIQQLNMSLTNYKMYRAQDVALIKKLRVDIKRINNVITSQSKTIYKLTTQAYDSVRVDTITNIIHDTVKVFRYKDKWLTLEGVLDNKNIVHAEIESIDSLIYIEHFIPKRFWFIKWGVKERKEEIISLNPHTTIVSSKFIHIKDR